MPAVKDEFISAEEHALIAQMTRRQLECKTMGRLRGKKRDTTERVVIKQQFEMTQPKQKIKKAKLPKRKLDDQLGAWAAQMDGSNDAAGLS